MSNLINLSRFISLILRHKPQVASLKLDKHGYADTKQLIAGINKTGKYSIDFDTLKHIVETDDKNRYSFNSDLTKIRANQGHSINVDVQLKECKPPMVLYHGTAQKYVESIYEKGLISKNRLYVHLSSDLNTAYNVGKRHGSVRIFEIDADKMHKDGYKFFLSENNVWLTKSVPTKYLTEVRDKND